MYGYGYMYVYGCEGSSPPVHSRYHKSFIHQFSPKTKLDLLLIKAQFEPMSRISRVVAEGFVVGTSKPNPLVHFTSGVVVADVKNDALLV
jgi:hypothetical protein